MTRPNASFRKYISTQPIDSDRIEITIGVEMPAKIRLGSIALSRAAAAEVGLRLLRLSEAAAPKPTVVPFGRHRPSGPRIGQ